jgi:hypothetical protein
MIAFAHLDEFEARKRYLETAIRALHGVEETINPRHDTLGIKKSKIRVRKGGHLVRLRRVIKRMRGSWTEYLDSGVLPFSRRSGYDYIDEWYLYIHGEGYDFAKLAKMRTKEIQDKAHELRGTLHDDRIADRLAAERQANSQQLAALIISQLDNEDLYEAGQLICDGWVPAIFEEVMLDAVTRPDEW